MARQARKRFVVTGNYRVNGEDMRGVIVILLGPCSFSGRMKDDSGKKLRKADYDHFLLRFADRRKHKEIRVSSDSFTFSKKYFPSYFEEVLDF